MKRILIIPIILSPFALNAMEEKGSQNSHTIIATLARGTCSSMRILDDDQPMSIVQLDEKEIKTYEYTIVASLLNVVDNKATMKCSIKKTSCNPHQFQ